ncbi:hypothetical protein ABI59_20225 [Acidobacteria bacterium Mor1]|nr:hypothetical protein ABI59_20225 [Acidobacteria bacterium Mor1]
MQKSIGAVRGTFDFYFRRKLKQKLGGSFNGQDGRKRLVSQILEELSPAAIIETGTYRGGTTQYLSQTQQLPIYSIESEPRFHYYARWRLRGADRVELFLGDSRSGLRELAGRQELRDARLFFYLDAHWYDDLPLLGEMQIIADSWKEWIVLVDDFCVPGDEGYGFDDYGPTKCLSVDCLGDFSSFGAQAWFPSIPSDQESGLRRGSILLARGGEVVETLSRMSALRPLPADA